MQTDRQMRRTTHAYIADCVAAQFKQQPLSYYEQQQLRYGAVIPDDWRDYPHHYGKEADIRKRLVTSRKAWLEDRGQDACFNLGVAFHYLADKWTLMNGSDPRHSAWERDIDKNEVDGDTCNPVYYSDLETLEKEEYWRVIEKLREVPIGKRETLNKSCICRPSTWSSPSIDLNMAYRVSLTMAQSVLGPKTAPPQIQDKIEKSAAIAKKILSTKRFKLAWFTLFITSLAGMVLLIGFSPWFIFVFLPLIFAEVCSATMFQMKASAFRMIKSFEGVYFAWGMLVFLASIISIGGILVLSYIIPLISTLIVAVSLFLQSFLHYIILNDNAMISDLFSYTGWFNPAV